MAISNEQLLALLKKNPLVTGVVVLSLLLVGAIYFRLDAMPEANAALEAKSAEGRRLAENIKNSAQLTEQLAAVTEANKEITSRLVRVGQLANNLQYFYRLEADTGIKLLDLRQVTQSRAPANAAKFPVTFSVSVQGSYPQVFDFLRRLESGSHYCRVMTANLVPADDAGGASLLRPNSARLTLNLELLGQP
ncbi:MAG TPA: hypothetical protein PLF88_02480 [Opitutaceae bacterium]|nr:hypothetical protein [Opitutaceae bacterium]HRJ46026.1 hypothetical protein [Opitutaceae bacterium]